MGIDPKTPFLAGRSKLFLLGLAAVLWILFLGSPAASWENLFFDEALRLRALSVPPAADPRILHLDIVQSDLENLPTLESEYAALERIIREAADLGAELIALDILLRRGNEQISGPLLAALKQSGKALMAEGLVKDPESFSETKLRSFPFLEAPLQPAGLINIQADPDGIYRRYHFAQIYKNQPLPSLALAAYFRIHALKFPEDILWDAKTKTLSWQELSKDGMSFASRKLRVTRHPNAPLLDFRNSWAAKKNPVFPHITLRGLEALSQKQTNHGGLKPLEGKILFVSYLAAGVSDFGATPFGGHEPLVQLHSTALNDLLQNTFHQPLPRWGEALLTAAVIFLAVLLSFVRRQSFLILGWLSGLFFIFAAGLVFIWKTQWLLPACTLALFWTLSCGMDLLMRQITGWMEKIQLRTTLGYYFSPRVLEKVLSDPGSMHPQQAEVTVLLTDLRNFTPLSEKLGTYRIFELCNQVFDAQTHAVMGEDGSLEHFLGDQFLSYWGAPSSQLDAADRALNAVKKLMLSMETIRKNLPDDIRELFGYGAALHAGGALIGNKGSQKKMDYGLMGDLINSAARVESLTKFYGIPFMMTREVYAKLSSKPPFRQIDSILAVGKSMPLELIEINHPFASPYFDKISEAYQPAFRDYQKGNFEKALTAFTEIGHSYGDLPSRILAKRCKELSSAPPENWTGIYRFTTK